MVRDRGTVTRGDSAGEGTAQGAAAPLRGRRILLLLSIGLALLYWVSEAVRHATFQGGSFQEQVFPADGIEILVRASVAGLIVLLGVYAHLSIHRHHRVRQQLTECRTMLEDQVAVRTAELADANEQLRRDLLRRRELEKELDRHRNHLEELLEQRTGELKEANRRLEREVVERGHVREALRESKRMLQEAQRIAGTGSWQVDIPGDVFHMSPTMRDIYGLDTCDVSIEQGFHCVHPDDQSRAREAMADALNGKSVSLEYRICRPDGEVRHVFTPGARLVANTAGNPAKLIGVTQDITERRHTDRELKIAGQIMEAKHLALREKNVALKNILNQVDSERQELKSQIRSNVDRAVMPTLRLLKRKVDASTAEYVDLLDSNLRQITSPFVNRLESSYSRLSPGEIDICNMIKNGLSSKEMAEIRGVSVQTISQQRKRIRRKLGIANKGVNLPALLKSLSN